MSSSSSLYLDGGSTTQTTITSTSTTLQYLAPTPTLYNGAPCPETLGVFQCYGSQLGRCVYNKLQLLDCYSGTTCITDSGNYQAFCGWPGVSYPPTMPTPGLPCGSDTAQYKCYYGNQLGKCVNGGLQLVKCGDQATCQSDGNGGALCVSATTLVYSVPTGPVQASSASSASASYAATSSAVTSTDSGTPSYVAPTSPLTSPSATPTTTSASSSITSAYITPTPTLLIQGAPCDTSSAPDLCTGNQLGYCATNGTWQIVACPDLTTCSIDMLNCRGYCGLVGLPYFATNLGGGGQYSASDVNAGVGSTAVLSATASSPGLYVVPIASSVPMPACTPLIAYKNNPTPGS